MPGATTSASRSLPLGILAAAGFLSAAGARVIDPLLAVIAEDFSRTVPAVSIVVAAFTLPYGLNQLLLGPLGDRYGKLRLMLGALIGYAVFTGACAMAANLPALTLLRACAGASSAGLIPICLAYIGDAVPYEHRHVTISRFLTGVVLAQTVAGPLGGLFGEYLGWRGVFVLLAILALLVATLLAVQLRDLPDRRGTITFNPQTYKALARMPKARLLLAATVVEGALMAGVFPFLAPYLHERFALSFAEVGLILACFGPGALIYTRAAPRLVPWLREPGLVLLGGALISTALLLGMASPHWAAFILVQMALGLGYFMLHAVLQARASELLPEARSTAVSLFVFMLFFGQSLGALAMGAAIAALGYRGAFTLDACGIAVLTLWLSRFLRRWHA